VSQLIAEYIDALARELSFDRSLSRRVCEEVEDHLRESTERHPAGTLVEAERHAIERFGPARTIAAQFAATSLLKRSRAVGPIVLLIVLGVFAAMKARLAWYAATGWTVSGPSTFQDIGVIAYAFDRYAFYLALIGGLCAWAYASRMPSSTLDKTRLQRSFMLSAAAVAALMGSVLADIVLTALRLSGAGWSLSHLIPIASVAIEVALVAVVIASIHAVTSLVATATLRFDL
jgi:HAAS domain-containing protein